MKNLFFLLIIFALVSCKKQEVYGPMKLKNGQTVELLVSHRLDSDTDLLIKQPGNETTNTSLSGFDEREPGYNYRVKAKFVHDEDPPQDASSEYFIFEKIISKEQYKGNESFTIQLITNYVVGGPNIRLGKTGNDYYFIPDKLQLTFTDNTVQNELEEIWLNAQEVRANWKTGQLPKWKAIKATVVHDQKKFGKAYLVKQIQFIQ